MIPYGHQSTNESDIKAVTEVLKSDWLTQGPKIGEFEKKLAGYCGVKYAVVFSSGTAALHGAYFVAGLKKGDEFITSPLTFAATANAGLYLGARAVFADIDENGNLDFKEARKKINKKTKAIAVVDYAGRPADLSEFKKIAKKNNLILIEDACHALGAKYNGKKIGSISDMTIFSFHPVKSITTGEGGAVLTNNRKYYEKLKIFRSHGITKDNLRFKSKTDGDWYYEMQYLGFNYRMTDIQAALGISQLKRLDKFIKARRKIVKNYKLLFRNYLKYIDIPKDDAKKCHSAWHLYVIKLKGGLIQKRAEIFKKLREIGIGVQVHYIPVYLQPHYRLFGYKEGLCPQAEKFYKSIISLPIYPDLKFKDQKYVAKKLIAIFEKNEI